MQFLTCTHGAALASHSDGVDAGRQAADLGAGGDTARAHAVHTVVGVGEPAAALRVFVSVVHAP